MNDKSKQFITISVVLISLLFGSTLFSIQAEKYKVLLGKWDIELVEPPMYIEFVFTYNEDALSGEMNFEMGSGVLEEIVFEEKKLTFLDVSDKVIYISEMSDV